MSNDSNESFVVPPTDPETQLFAYSYPGLGDRVIQFRPISGLAGWWSYSCPVCKSEASFKRIGYSDTCIAFLMHYVTHLEMKRKE